LTIVGLQGKVALVTGGGRGIGRGIARSLLEAGARVEIAARTEADLDETVGLLSPLGEIATRPCDVSDASSVRALVDDVVGRFGSLDILVCCHGIHNAERPFLELREQDWDRTIAVNLKGAFLCGQATARVMVEQGRGGRIVNVSSINALASEPDCSDYNASKGGLNALTRSMAFDLGRFGITVNVIAPGWVRSPMSAPYLSEEILTGKQVMNLVRRVGEPEDIGTTVVWLADPGSSYVTGATIVVDGGQSAMLPMPVDIDLE
jgi:NAD(P)-dependent dehydrogenase (short-subunit alcohol dehydrogenase family)